jgi:hypothetical protein
MLIERRQAMEKTKKIPRRQWKGYFDRFTKRHLRDDRPEAATLELLSPALGDQVEVEGARLLGISYDPRSEALEVLLENVDHLVFRPNEIWVVEEADGFLPSAEIVRNDGTKEILTVRRAGSLAVRSATALQARSASG